MVTRRTGALGLAILASILLLAWSLVGSSASPVVSAAWLIIGIGLGALAVRLAWLRPFSEASQPRS